ncbi:hypothetical protein WwSim0577 [Wolbachia endosymbiont of Drosophila simulans]|nr:hypothetical protein WwSim0577 [Wolbachia endosymbiont of Drosophila simulans]
MSIRALAADRAKFPPEPIAATPSSGSRTSPVPVITNEIDLSATIIIASNFLRYLSILQSFASSTHALINCPGCLSSLDSNLSKRVNASAVAPANPAITESPERRLTFFAPDFITVWPSETCPSPITTTLLSFLIDNIVVPYILLLSC